MIKNGGKPDFNRYINNECRKSLCWTNKSRKIMKYNWMHEESRNKRNIVINDFKVFVGLTIVC